METPSIICNHLGIANRSPEQNNNVHNLAQCTLHCITSALPDRASNIGDIDYVYFLIKKPIFIQYSLS